MGHLTLDMSEEHQEILIHLIVDERTVISGSYDDCLPEEAEGLRDRYAELGVILYNITGGA